MGRGGTDLVSRFTAWFDAFQRRRLGIWEFSEDPQCILRLGIARARAPIALPDGTRIARGDRVAIMHLWSERVPAIPESGPDLAWARAAQRAFVYSLRLVAREFESDPRLRDVAALGNEVSLAYGRGTVHMFERLGFSVLPADPGGGPAGWVRARVSRVWTWLLRHTFNRPSTRDASPGEMDTRPIWMSRRSLLERHGTDLTP